MMHLHLSRRLCGLVALLALLLATLACNGSAVLVASTPKWACPSPTPKPYGAAGPIKRTEEYDCTTDSVTGVRTCKTRSIYYEEWEQEYGDLPGPPFPSPTPYGIKGTSYPMGYRVAIGPLFALVDATVGDVQTNGEQLTTVHITWLNQTAEAIPYSVNDLVRVRAITDPSGRILSTQRWGVTHASRVAAGITSLPTNIPSGDSAVSVPILTPIGAPKTVELEFPGVPAALGATPTTNPDLAAAPASLIVTWTRTTALSGCSDPGALTPWGDGPGISWGRDAPIGTPAPGGTNRLIQIAMEQVGKPYVWGAKGPEVFDCSGLTEWSYAQIGIRIGDAIVPTRPARLVEGVFDALAVQQVAGDLVTPVATGTTGARRARWIALLSCAPVVLVSYDNDAARYWLDALAPHAVRWRPFWDDPAAMLADDGELRAWIQTGLSVVAEA